MAENNESRLFGGDSLTGYLNARLASVSSLAERITHAQFLAASPGALKCDAKRLSEDLMVPLRRQWKA